MTKNYRDGGMRFSVAPMLDWTDRHCRAFHRVLSRHALLYTEMVTTGAILYGPRERLLSYGETEHPVAVQLGGSSPKDLAECARICADYGYDEINLNVGCPSDRVQNGAFGACLMLEPEIVAECVSAMKAVVSLPVTVKCRIGVDDQEPEVALFTLAEKVVAAGVDALIVHARKAWLKGLSPKENRDVPPLDYPLVHRLKQMYPDIPMAINGGIADWETITQQLEHMDGVMVGRAAYQEPEMLLEVDQRLFEDDRPVRNSFEAVEAYEPYIASQLEQGQRLSQMTRHMLGLFAGQPGARLYRRHLATEAVKREAGLEVLHQAVELIRQQTIRQQEILESAN
ncbi:tRNA dihydrouridine(20/20a) synthase DusA [Microvirga sp. W0021]|uniref:tRNA-dihydrouridine(20/20a) synthase n=1 Tax=Hohaiivirga grylli TaxID=3133970 RepID=A0ABV0BJK1_9HYPH